MNKTLLAASIATLLLSACGGSSETAKNEQPWLGDGSPPGGTPVNLPPKINGVPAGMINVVFGQSEKLALTAIDPEGKSVTLSLSAAPSWVSIDTNGVVTIAPETMVDGQFVVQASDGVNTVSSATIAVDVLAPSSIKYTPSAPAGSKEGDVFTLSFISPLGVATSFTTILNGKDTVPLQIPYPYDPSWDKHQVVTHWDPSQRGLAAYQRWNGPVKSLYEGLGDTLTIPASSRDAHVPNALSSAYLHGLHQRGFDLTKGSPFTTETSHQTVGADSASTLLELAALYQLAHDRTDLSELNKSLRADYVKQRTDVGIGDLAAEVDKVRRDESTLINDRYWSDLLSQTIASLERPSIDWKPGRSQLLMPVDALFGSGVGQTLDLQEDGSYQIRGQSFSWLTGVEGVWTVNGRDLHLSYPTRGQSGKAVDIPYDPDPVLLRERLMSTLNISFATATEWVAMANKKGGSLLKFTVAPTHRLEVSPVIGAMSGERPVTVSAVSTVRFEDADLTADSIREQTERVWRSIPNQQPSYFEHRNEIYDVVLPWPSQSGEFELNTFNWLSLYDAPVVRERFTLPGQSVTEKSIDWQIQYDASLRQFSFLSIGHPAGEMSYTVSLSGTPLMDRKQVEVHNSRRYAGHAELHLNGTLVYDGPVSMTLVPKSRCEVSTRCEPDPLYQANTLWVDTQWGLGKTHSGVVLVPTTDPSDPSKTQNIIQPVQTGSYCVGEVRACLVSDGPGFTIRPQAYAGKSVWHRNEGAMDPWHPIQVSQTSFTVWAERGAPVHRVSTPLDPSNELWRCSYINPQVSKVFSSTDQAAKDALTKSCSKS